MRVGKGYIYEGYRNKRAKKRRKIVRVAAYARVSSDKDAAFHSLEAQEESRSLSENIRWAKRKSVQEGKVYLAYTHLGWLTSEIL